MSLGFGQVSYLGYLLLVMAVQILLKISLHQYQ